MSPGPVVTLYELSRRRGSSPRVIGLADDIAARCRRCRPASPWCRAQTSSASSCPTPKREMVYFRELIAPRTSKVQVQARLALAKTIGGEP